MNIHPALAALIATPILTLTQSSWAQNSQQDSKRLALETKPAVVRVVSICRTEYQWKPRGKDFLPYPIPIDLSFIGTGFLINPDGYIVTGARALDINRNECEKRLKDNIVLKINEDYNVDKRRTLPDLEKEGDFDFKYQPGKVYLPNARAKPLPFEVEAADEEQGQNVSQDVAIIKIPLTDAPTLKLGDSNQVEISDPILTIGYPSTADLNLANLGQFLTEESFNESSVAEGRISSTNKQAEGSDNVLQVDIQAGIGSGGSPLIIQGANNQAEVIGMLAYNDSTKGATIPLAIPARTIQQFIRKSGATNEQGETDRSYKEGLDLFRQQNYEQAKAKFLSVQGLFSCPSEKGVVSCHSEVDRLIRSSDRFLFERYRYPWKNPTYLLLGALVAGGSVVAALTYFLLRRQSRTKKASPVSLGSSAEHGSDLNTSYQGNGVGTQTLELEYQGQIRRYQLNKDEHHLGRDPKWSDINIPTSWEAISRKHAILRKEGEDYRIYDGDGIVASRNGLWIDSLTRVDQYGYLLQNGDQIKIGTDPHEQITLTYFNPISSQAEVRPTSMA